MAYTGSKKELLELIKQHGTLSVDEAVLRTNLAKTTLREHFLQLERDGVIRREYLRSGPGRPSLQYQITARGNRLFPSSEPELIRELLRFLKNRGEEKAITEFFGRYWQERLAKARQKMADVPPENLNARLEKLKNFLEEEGFMPNIALDEANKKITIKACNCPFSEVVKETRLPCKLEAMFYKKLFAEDVERTSFFAEGDFSCTYNVPMEKQQKNRTEYE